MRNQAFAFLKPHAMGSQPVVNAVADRLEEAGVRVSHMERIGADRLVAEGLYDRHVGPVARAALAPDPAALFDADIPVGMIVLPRIFFCRSMITTSVLVEPESIPAIYFADRSNVMFP